MKHFLKYTLMLCIKSLFNNWVRFIEIGVGEDHIHFLIQSTPEYSPTKTITTVKSLA